MWLVIRFKLLCIACLHTLHRNPHAINRPFLLVGRSVQGIDFDALDGELTHLLFVLGLKYEELYLPWMQKLLQMLTIGSGLKQLMQVEGAQAIFDHLARMEEEFCGQR